MIKMFHPNIYKEAEENVLSVLRSGYVGEGQWVKKLQEYFSTISGAKNNLAVNSGTSALHMAMILAGISDGDEVITTAQTMVATSHAILMQKATPIFADIQTDTANICPKSIKNKITPKTKAVVVVHWGGYPCDMDEINEIAKLNNILVIEDAAHAIGATYNNKKIGCVGDITCFSFQSIKHITGGDAGMISFNNHTLLDYAIQLRWFGIHRDKRKQSILGEPLWDIKTLGYKYQTNDIAASIVMGNIIHLDEILKHREEIADIYYDELKNVGGLKLLKRDGDRKSSNWLFTIMVENRENFILKLKSNNIDSSIVHARIDGHSLYADSRSEELPNLNIFTDKQISIPIHNNMSLEDAKFICSVIKSGW